MQQTTVPGRLEKEQRGKEWKKMQVKGYRKELLK
jgi:hypothetical protein